MPSTRRFNHNVVLTFAFRVSDGIATGIWSSSVLSNYIFSTDGNQRVGIAQAVQGTFLVAAAIPAAWLASHVRRDTILRCLGGVAMCAIALTTVSLLYAQGTAQFLWLCASLALWGVAQANAPVLDALFADSVPTGKRTALYTLLHISYILSQGLGPAVAALVFYLHGNEWSTQRLRDVMLCGMVLAVIPALLLLLFDDSKCLGHESEGLLKVLSQGQLPTNPSSPSLYTHSEGGKGHSRAANGDTVSPLRQPLLTGQHYDDENSDMCGDEGAVSEGGSLHEDVNGQGVDVTSQVHTQDTGGVLSDAQDPPAAGTGTLQDTSDMQPGAHTPSEAATTADSDSQQASPQPPAAADTVDSLSAMSRPEPESHAIALSDYSGSARSSPALSHRGAPSPRHTHTHRMPTAPTTQQATRGAAPTSRLNPMRGLAVTPPTDTHSEQQQQQQQPYSAASSGETQDSGNGAFSGYTPFQSALSTLMEGGLEGMDSGDMGGVMSPGGPKAAGSPRLTGPMLSPWASHRRTGLTAVTTSASVKSLGDWLPNSSSLSLPSHNSSGVTSQVSHTSVGVTSQISHTSSVTTQAASNTEQPQLSHTHTASSNAKESTDEIAASLTFSQAPDLADTVSAGEALQGLPGPQHTDTDSTQRVAEGTASGAGEQQGAQQDNSAQQGPSGGVTQALQHRSVNVLIPTGSDQFGGSDVAPTLQRGMAGSNANTAPQSVTGTWPTEEDPATPALRLLPWGHSHSPSHSPSLTPHHSSSSLWTSEDEDCDDTSLLHTPDTHTPGTHTPGAWTRERLTSESPSQPYSHTGEGEGDVYDRAEAGWGGDVRGAGPSRRPSSEPTDAHVVFESLHKLHANRRLLCLGVTAIPPILAITDCLMGLASGMTIKFFPIFFREEVQLTPVQVSLMYTAIPLCLSTVAALAQRQARVIGRVQTMVMNRAIGIALLYWIASHVEQWVHPAIMVPVYIARTSIMNANYPMQRALLMDYVPKEDRAKWNSLESVTSFGWSGSAAVGGWLISTYGFQVTFLVTACMQLLGWLCSTLLLPLVPRQDLSILVKSNKSDRRSKRGQVGERRRRASRSSALKRARRRK